MRTLTIFAALLTAGTTYGQQTAPPSDFPISRIVAPPSIQIDPICPCPAGKCNCLPADCKCPGCTDPTKVAVRVDYDLGGGFGSGGSGVVIWSEGGKSLVVTNKHVVDSGISGKVTHAGKTYPCKFVGWSEEGDVALLEVAESLPFAKMANVDVASGTKVTHYGNATGPKTGAVVIYVDTMSPRYSWSGKSMHTTYVSDSGDSGGGVYTVDGKLVAIHWGGVDGNKEAVPVSVVRRLLGRLAAKRFDRLSGQLSAEDKVPAATQPTTYFLPGSSNYCPTGNCPNVIRR